MLKLVAYLRPILGQGQDLRTVFGHQDRVLELSRQATVESSNGPAIVRVELASGGARVDHRFDREAHPGIQPVLSGLTRWHVRNVWPLVESCSDAVANILVDNTKSWVTLLYEFDNGFADHGNRTAGTQRVDSDVE